MADSKSSSSSTATSSIGYFGLWQIINIVLAISIDAPWNKVQRWPAWDWFNIESVFFPTVAAVTLALILLVAVSIGALFVLFVSAVRR